MLKYRLIPEKRWRLEGMPIEEAFVFLDAKDLDDIVEIQYEGPKQLLDEIKEALIGSYGMYGRVIGPHTRGWDLQASMCEWIMRRFDPVMIEGESLFDDAG